MLISFLSYMLGKWGISPGNKTGLYRVAQLHPNLSQGGSQTSQVSAQQLRTGDAGAVAIKV